MYSELYFGNTPPKSLKSFGQDGLIIHCSSFSKSLAQGYHVGYDRHLRKLRHILACSQASMSAIMKYFPKDIVVTKPAGGYFCGLS